MVDLMSFFKTTKSDITEQDNEILKKIHLLQSLLSKNASNTEKQTTQVRDTKSNNLETKNKGVLLNLNSDKDDNSFEKF